MKKNDDKQNKNTAAQTNRKQKIINCARFDTCNIIKIKSILFLKIQQIPYPYGVPEFATYVFAVILI